MTSRAGTIRQKRCAKWVQTTHSIGRTVSGSPHLDGIHGQKPCGGAGTYVGLMKGMDAIGANLRYIKAEQLATVEDRLDAAVVVGPQHNVLGRLAGALVDPLRRHVCFFVVESRSWFATHQYALPLATARFDRAHKELVVDVEPDGLREVHVDRFTRFSDQDLLDAMFAPRAA